MKTTFIKDLTDLFYPDICPVCDAHLMAHESTLCLACVHKLPKTYFWDYDVNPIEELFWGRLDLAAACSFLHFYHEGPVQRLMHRFKYEGKREIGTELGRLFGHQLKEKGWFRDVTVIVPVPLHRAKQIRRGYNQSEFIANGLSETLEIPARTRWLERVVSSESQTTRSRYQRSENVDNVFAIKRKGIFKDQHVLLVDDVVTTGATLEAAGKTILESGASSLAIATLACV